MLVFSPGHLDILLDIFITNYQPVCQPLTRRTLPANVIYRYARFAHYRCGEGWVEELIEAATQRIEDGTYVGAIVPADGLI